MDEVEHHLMMGDENACLVGGGDYGTCDRVDLGTSVRLDVHHDRGVAALVGKGGVSDFFNRLDFVDGDSLACCGEHSLVDERSTDFPGMLILCDEGHVALEDGAKG